MIYDQASRIIWAPDLFELEEVAEAVVTVLSAEPAERLPWDTYQASYLVSTVRPYWGGLSEKGEART